MAKGAIAKQNLVNKFIEAAGEMYVGDDDGKKFYFWSEEDGEKMQVCVQMTIPKTPFGSVNAGDLGMAQPEAAAPAEISEEDKAKVDDLMRRLGLI